METTSSNTTPYIDSSTTTARVVYNKHLFLQTATCQAIAGAFTWAAILITGYHVSRKNEEKGEETLRDPTDLDLPPSATLHGPSGTEMDCASIVHRANLFFCLVVESGDVHQ